MATAAGTVTQTQDSQKDKQATLVRCHMNQTTASRRGLFYETATLFRLKEL